MPHLLDYLRPPQYWPRVLVVITVAFACRHANGEDTGLGLATSRPTQGRFVQTRVGFMVPYRANIPGSNVAFLMVPVPGGKTILGSPVSESGRANDEGPQIEVALEPFWIGAYEVTWAEYNQYYDLRNAFRRFEELKIRRIREDNEVDAVTAPTSIYDPPRRLPSDPNRQRRLRYPAVSMTQFAAKQYTKWLSKLTGDFYRLPSEAEWEYACRAGSMASFHHGDHHELLGDYAWFAGNSQKGPKPAGLKKPNAWGLYDMHGNAAEWVLDGYNPDGYRDLKSGDSFIAWPRQVERRVVRGGSWNHPAERCRSAARLASSADWQAFEANVPPSPWWLAGANQTEIGFRIVRPLSAPKLELHPRYWDADSEKLKEALQIRLGEQRGYVGLVDERLPQAISELPKQ